MPDVATRCFGAANAFAALLRQRDSHWPVRQRPQCGANHVQAGVDLLETLALPFQRIALPPENRREWHVGPQDPGVEPVAGCPRDRTAGAVSLQKVRFDAPEATQPR